MSTPTHTPVARVGMRVLYYFGPTDEKGALVPSSADIVAVKGGKVTILAWSEAARAFVPLDGVAWSQRPAMGHWTEPDPPPKPPHP